MCFGRYPSHKSTPSSVIYNKTPYEILFYSTPSFCDLRTIECLALSHNQPSKDDKFAS